MVLRNPLFSGTPEKVGAVAGRPVRGETRVGVGRAPGNGSANAIRPASAVTCSHQPWEPGKSKPLRLAMEGLKLEMNHFRLGMKYL